MIDVCIKNENGTSERFLVSKNKVVNWFFSSRDMDKMLILSWLPILTTISIDFNSTFFFKDGSYIDIEYDEDFNEILKIIIEMGDLV